MEDRTEGETHVQQTPPIALDGVVDLPPAIHTSSEGYDVGGNENAKTGNNNTKGKILPAAGNVGPFSALSSAAAPSLEAVLLDRKRRLAAGGGQTSATPMPFPSQKSSSAVFEQQRPATAPRVGSNIKGKFKSTPLEGGERSGMVVAEKVKEDLRNFRAEVSFPDKMNKAGHFRFGSEGA